MRKDSQRPNKVGLPAPVSFSKRRRLHKLVFCILSLLCCFVCILILTTANTTYYNFKFRNYSEDITTKDDSTSKVSERIRSITEDIRIPPEDESRLLYEKVRVLCWVLTMPSNHVTRARHVKVTWGRRCNRLLFMSSTPETTLGAINLNVSEGRQFLWNKTQNAFKYVYENHFNDADWFLKADDDTYVIVENLRHFLSNYSSSDPVYFGYHYGATHVSGGAGYVLSKRAVELLVERGLRPGACPNESAYEDMQLGACLNKVGVVAGDSRDSQGRERFMPLVPVKALLENYEYYEDHPFNSTIDFMCSDTAISFHYVQPGEMYVIEFFIYHLNLKGGPYPELDAIAYPLS